MWDIAFKNVMRNKTRTFLTVLGILIGIGAIVGLGSIAEGINEAVQSGLELTAGKIIVTEKGSGFFGFTGELTDEDVEVIKEIGGIKEIVPVLSYAENLQLMKGAECYVIGIEPEKIEYFVGESIGMDDGRKLEEGDADVAIIGKDTADKYNLGVGDTWTIKDRDFEIVGVIEKTNTPDIDSSIVVSLQDLQNLLDTDSFQIIYVIPNDVKDTEKIAEEIEDSSDRLDAVTTKEFARQASQLVEKIRFFTVGIGAVAAVVGGLGVMNTMIMAVMERRREIGVMKAIGATNTMILKQILTESGVISLVGGVGGVVLGIAVSIIIGKFAGGTIQAVVTPWLVFEGLGFALLLGLLGGYYPARKASKLDPVEALRYE